MMFTTKQLRRRLHRNDINRLRRYRKLLLTTKLPLPRYIAVPVPGDQRIPILAHVHGIEVGVRHVSPLDPIVGEKRDVAMTHCCLS
jgi:hypothetical protein